LKLKYSIHNKNERKSFYAKRKNTPYLGDDWHYHDEYELYFPISGSGVRIVGDSMEYYSSNELVMCGSNLPHLFKTKSDYDNHDRVVVKFSKALIWQIIENVPEFNKIKQLLKKSSRGILFPESKSYALVNDFISLSQASGADRLIQLLEILNKISKIEDIRMLTSDSYKYVVENNKEDRLQRVVNFIIENFDKEISLKELADISYMTTNSFCRFFKERTNKTAFEFIREYRISKACQMIINSNKTISQICDDTGFNSFSSFNRVFKSIKGITATEFKYMYQEINSAS
jgi:AraC-like DNA-binding protein